MCTRSVAFEWDVRETKLTREIEEVDGYYFLITQSPSPDRVHVCPGRSERNKIQSFMRRELPRRGVSDGGGGRGEEGKDERRAKRFVNANHGQTTHWRPRAGTENV